MLKVSSKSVMIFVCVSMTPKDDPYEKWPFSPYHISRNLKLGEDLTILAYRPRLVLHQTIVGYTTKFCVRVKSGPQYVVFSLLVTIGSSYGLPYLPTEAL